MTHPTVFHRFVRYLGAALICAAAMSFAGTTLGAQTVTVQYQRLLDREAAARGLTPPAKPPVLRAAAKAYENFVRRHPVTGYSDNALFQGAGLFKLAFERSGDPTDREEAARLLTWLRKEYPASSLGRQASESLAALAAMAPPASPTTAHLAPSSATAANAPTPPATAPPPPPAATTAPATVTPATDAQGRDTAASAEPAATVRSITRTALPKGDRVTIELSREVGFVGDRVDNPDRVFFDLSNVAVPAATAEGAARLAGPLLKTLRVGRPQRGVTRVVLEVQGRPRYSAFQLYNPFRLVIDLESDTLTADAAAPAEARPAPGVPAAAGVPKRPDIALANQPLAAPPPSPAATTPAPPATSPAAAPAATAATGVAPAAAPASASKPLDAARLPPAPPAATSRGNYSLARQLGLGVSRIVIDAGHGGHDPGARGNGLTESEVVLDVALRLEKLLLDQPGFEVVLTRRTNEYIALEERTAIANREGADLFLSIHANASRQATARGIETYFLNFATNPQAEEVAARENATSSQSMGTLPAILKAIALNNKLSESRELATMVQTSMMRRMVSNPAGARDLGVKQAPFVVLIGAQMPSVLAEISFLTNRVEASLLKQMTQRQRIAQALCDAILKYQGSLKKVTGALN